MDRSKRFHQKRVAKIRKIRRIYEDLSWHEIHPYWAYWKQAWTKLYDRPPRHERWWHKRCQPCDYSKNPSRWNHAMNIQPARAEANRKLDAVVRGVESDLLIWPDYKKPCEYYW